MIEFNAKKTGIFAAGVAFGTAEDAVKINKNQQKSRNAKKFIFFWIPGFFQTLSSSQKKLPAYIITECI